jgi:Tfp pilus assembly protein PilW
MMIAAFSFFLVGVVGTMLVVRFYYAQSANELRRESENLRRCNTLLLHAMEKAGWIKIKRDKQGEMLGFMIDSNFSLPTHSSDDKTIKLGRGFRDGHE